MSNEPSEIGDNWQRPSLSRTPAQQRFPVRMFSYTSTKSMLSTASDHLTSLVGQRCRAVFDDSIVSPPWIGSTNVIQLQRAMRLSAQIKLVLGCWATSVLTDCLVFARGATSA